MTRRELTEAEVQQALQMPEPNSRKSFVQSLIIDYLVEHGHVLASCHTRFGKLYMCRLLLERYRTVSDSWVNVVLPTNPIKDEFKAFLGHIPKVRFYLIATYCGNHVPAEEYNCGLFIGDEAHNFLNVGAKRNSLVLERTRAVRRLLLSATVDSSLYPFMEAYGIHHEFYVPLKTGARLGIVPLYQNLNVPVQLTAKEQAAYVVQDAMVQDRLRIFERVSPSKAHGLAMLCAAVKTPAAQNAIAFVADRLQYSKGTVIGAGVGYRSAVNRRMDLLYNAEAKPKAALEILRRVPLQKILLFGNRIATGEQLNKCNALVQVYRTGTTKQALANKDEILRKFYAEENPFLYACKNLNEGFTVNGCSLAINIGIKSKAGVEDQKTGRLLGLDDANPDKIATKINLYAENFMTLSDVGPVKVYSQEKRWLQSSQKDQLFVYYLSGIDELADYITINT